MCIDDFNEGEAMRYQVKLELWMEDNRIEMAIEYLNLVIKSGKHNNWIENCAKYGQPTITVTHIGEHETKPTS